VHIRDPKTKCWSLNASCAKPVLIFGKQCHCYQGNCEAEEVNGLTYVSLWEQGWGGGAWWYLHGPFSSDITYSTHPPPPTAITRSTYQSISPYTRLQHDDCSPKVLELLPANKLNW
jgi:hypothetical protein